MMTATTLAPTPAADHPVFRRRRTARRRRPPTTRQLAVDGRAARRRGLLPAARAVGAHRVDQERCELFTTFTFAPSTHLWDNIAELTAYRGGLYWRWMLNTALYAGVGAVALDRSSRRMAGYALAKFTFPGKKARLQRAARRRARARRHPRDPAVLPARAGRPDQHLLGRAAAAASSARTASTWRASTRRPPCPTEVIEAGRTDGAGELRHLAPHRACR